VSSAAAICCGGKRPGPGPTPLPNAPTLSCPADITLASHQGQPQPTANFDAPVATDGQPPVNVTCNPGSGNEFPNGTTLVTCEAVDAAARKGSCTFSVVVTLVPRIEKTKFLAFGDSITEGKRTLTSHTILTVPPNIFYMPGGYPDLLETKLTARYADQTITLIADGLGSEKAGAGKLRLEETWLAFNPDALLVMEGDNDLLAPETSTPAGMDEAIKSVTDALRRMIRFAKGRGARVYVATLLPVTPPKPQNVIAAVPTLNAKIRTLVAEEDATLVDLYKAVPPDLIGSDGLHPKLATYDLIAEEWLKAIIATLEINP
jgi:lysophospholipase L1-like esterase